MLARGGDLNTAKKMMYERKADFLHKDSEGYQPIHLAIKHGHLSLVEEILNYFDYMYDPYPDLSDLVTACIMGNVHVLMCFNAFSKYAEKQREHHACPTTFLYQTELELMLKGGASLESSLLHLALENKHLLLAEILVTEAKHLIDVVDYKGQRPLEVLVGLSALSQQERIKRLMNMLCPEELTFMQTACLWGSEKLVKKAISAIPVEKQDRARWIGNDRESKVIEHLKDPMEVIHFFKRVFTGRGEGENGFHLLPEGEKGLKIADVILEEISKKSHRFVSAYIFLEMFPHDKFGDFEALKRKWLSFNDCISLNMCDFDDFTFIRFMKGLAAFEGKPESELYEHLIVRVIKFLSSYSDDKMQADPFAKILMDKARLMLENGADANRVFEIFFRESAPKYKSYFSHNQTLQSLLQAYGWKIELYGVIDDVIFERVEVIDRIRGLSVQIEEMSNQLKSLWNKPDQCVSFDNPICLIKSRDKLAIRYQLLPSTTKEISLWDYDPDTWEAQLDIVKGEIEASVKKYSIQYDRVMRRLKMPPKEDKFKFRENKRMNLKEGECSGCVFDPETGEALFYKGKFYFNFGLSDLKSLLIRLKSTDRCFEGYYKTVKMPVGLLLEQKTVFLEEFRAWKKDVEAREKEELQRKNEKIADPRYIYSIEWLQNQIKAYAPEFSPFFEDLQAYAINGIVLMFSNVNIISQTLSLTIKMGNFKLDIHNVSFWRLREKLNLLNYWSIAAPEQFRNGELAYSLTETPYRFLKIADRSRVSVQALCAKFLESKIKNPFLSSYEEGIKVLVEKLKVDARVSPIDRGLLSESRLLAKELIANFDPLSDHEKILILQQLGRCGHLCIPEIRKTLNDVVRRYIFKISDTNEAIASKRLLARSLDIAKKRSFYNLVSVAYPDPSIEPDTHFLTHTANLLTNNPDRIALPSDLMSHVNESDGYNSRIDDLLHMDKPAIKRLFCKNMLIHLGPAFVHYYEELSKSGEQIDRESMLAVLADLQNAALKASSAEVQLEYKQMQERFSAENDQQLTRLQELNRRFKTLKWLHFRKITEYLEAKMVLAELAKKEETEDTTQASCEVPSTLSKKRKRTEVGDEEHSAKRSKIGNSSETNDILCVREGFSKISHQLETKIMRLSTELQEYFELEKSIENLTNDIQKTAHQNDLELSSFKQKLLNEKKWVLDEWDLQDQISDQIQVEGVIMRNDAIPPYTLTREGLIQLLLETGAIKSLQEVEVTQS